MERTYRPPEYSVNVENASLRIMSQRYNGVQAEQDDSVLVRHTHGYMEMFACGRGEMFIETEEGRVRIGAGEMAVIPPDRRHYKIPSAEEVQWCAVGIILLSRRTRKGRNLYRTLARVCRPREILVFRDTPELCGEVMEAVSAASGDSCLPALRLAAVLTALAERLPDFPADESAGTPTDGELQRISTLEMIVDSRYMEELHAEQIAQELFISTRQLSRIVRRRYGMPLHQVILRKRVQIAAKLLCGGGMSAEKIGAVVGFRTKSCFYRAFRDEFGTTPQEYRAENSGKAGDV